VAMRTSPSNLVRPNSRSFEPDAWMPTPLLRRPVGPLSNRMKFLIASAIAALPASYLVFGNFDRVGDGAITPQPTIDIPPLALLLLREAEAPPTEAKDPTVGSHTEPEAQTMSLQPPVRLDMRPTETTIEARPGQTLPERGKELFAASGYDARCYLSASAVRQNHPGGRPSWTLRAPGHEGTRCWYAETQTLAEAEVPSAKARNDTVETEPGVQTTSSQPAVRSDIKPTESGSEARPPRAFPESGKQVFAASGRDSSCYQSASDVRQNHPGAWPSWTLRAPGHEGTRCWYAGARITANDRRSEMAPRKETVGTEKLESPDALFDVQQGPEN
jgi:hypothetical protein